MKKIYLDHNATTPILPEVKAKMVEFMEDQWGNPSSLHSFGLRAREAREEARALVAKKIGASPSEIIFTSGGTEANCMALLGSARHYKSQGNHIIASPIEHPSVLNCLGQLKKEDFQVTFLKVDSWGRLDPDQLKCALTDQTILVSIMSANNETGIIQPIEKLGEILQDHPCRFHTDAVQVLGKMKVDVKKYQVQLASFSAHKIGGPMGAGALYIQRRTKISPLFYGGHQEYNLRRGTENMMGIVGMGEACGLIDEKTSLTLLTLRHHLQTLLTERIPRCKINTHPTESLSNTLSVTFPGIEGERLLFALDLEGVGVSTGSACSSGSLDPSAVLLAMGLSKKEALSTLRFSLGRENTQEDMEKVVQVLEKMF